jgi:hypothetical protein
VKSIEISILHGKSPMFDAKKSPAAPAIGLPLDPHRQAHRQAREAGELVIYHGTFKGREGKSLVSFIFQHIETIWNHACQVKIISREAQDMSRYVDFSPSATIWW